MTDTESTNERSKWPHFFAVTLVCATFPLIWVGGLVTTYDAGMAVPDWPTTYGYNMFLYPVSTWVSGPWDLFIEHGHRLLGSLAGILTIALNVAIWKFDSRRWMRWVGAAALLLVISQGLLGGMRVRMNSTDLARAHGCTGPLFFAVSVGIVVMTSKFWFEKERYAKAIMDRKLVVFGWVLVALTYLQLVLGAHLRHPGVDWLPTQFRAVVIFHVAVAVALVAHVFNVARQGRHFAWLKRPALLLLTLVAFQFVLGFATWRAKYGWPSFVPMVAEAKADQPMEIALHNTLVGGTVQSESMNQALTVTGHVAVGSLILATSVFYATRATRAYAFASTHVRQARKTKSVNEPVRSLAAGAAVT